MCYLVVERYSVCRCLYYKHSIDMCPAYGQHGHSVVERTLLVGYACEKHSNYEQEQYSSSHNPYSDSGYGTASHGSHRDSSRRHRRWNVLSSVTGYSWQSRPLVVFEFECWIQYLFSFRARTSSAPPSQLTLLLVGHDRLMPRSAPWSPYTPFHGPLHLSYNIHHIMSRRIRANERYARCHDPHEVIEGAKKRYPLGASPHTHTNTTIDAVFQVCSIV